MGGRGSCQARARLLHTLAEDPTCCDPMTEYKHQHITDFILSHYNSSLPKRNQDVSPREHTRYNPLLRAAPRRPSASPLLPHSLFPKTCHGQSGRYARSFPLRDLERRRFHSTCWRRNVCRFCGSRCTRDEGGWELFVRMSEFDGGVSLSCCLVESPWDAESVSGLCLVARWGQV